MTNLFTQLAARTLQLTPIVQPRIDSVFTPEIAAEAIEPTTPFAESATSDPIAQQSGNDVTADSVLVNPYHPTLPIAHAPRSVAPATVPDLAGDRVVSSVRGDQTVPDVSPAVARTVLETNFVTPHRDAALSPPDVQKRSSPVPADSPAANPNLIPPENVVPKAIASPAINANELEAPSDSELYRGRDRLSSLPHDGTLRISRDSLPVELAMENSVQTDSGTGQILVSHEILRRDRVAAQPSISPAPPSSPVVTISPVVIPRQTDVLLPPVALRRSRSPSHQPDEKSAPPSPPTIQVTIGRIEVRAVPPSAPPRPRAATPARLSLEDYLRSRSGGEG